MVVDLIDCVCLLIFLFGALLSKFRRGPLHVPWQVNCQSYLLIQRHLTHPLSLEALLQAEQYG